MEVGWGGRIGVRRPPTEIEQTPYEYANPVDRALLPGRATLLVTSSGVDLAGPRLAAVCECT